MREAKARNPEMQAIAKKLFEETGSGNEVARRMHISPPTAYLILKAAGVHIPGHSDPKPLRRKLSEDVATALVADYRGGMPLADLMAKYQVGEWTVRQACRRAEEKLRPRGGQRRVVTDEEKERIIALRKAGLSQALIASQLQMHQTTVSGICRAAGLYSLRREEHGSWSGGVVTRPDGYKDELLAPDDPLRNYAKASGYMLQHRLVMARHLGRPLDVDETVHHINGDRADNRIENLQLRHGRHGKGTAFACRGCGSHDVAPTRLRDPLEEDPVS